MTLTLGALPTRDPSVQRLQERVNTLVLYGAFNARALGCVGNGTDDDRAALDHIANTLMQPASGAKGGVLVLPPGSYAIASALTIPANVLLLPADGAELVPATSIAVTFSGYVPALPYQWLDLTAGSSSFVLSLPMQVDPRAWGEAGTAAPTKGTFVVGNWFANAAPTAGGKFGFTCTTGGSPGTWKAWGVIDA